MYMTILITGILGQLGYDSAKELLKRGHNVIGSDLASLEGFCERAKDLGFDMSKITYVPMDITDRLSVEKVIGSLCPDAVIHCAGWTAVDAAEDEENRAAVDLVNHIGSRYIAEACKKVDAVMLYISTDYVFDGSGDRPWDPDDKHFGPLNVYGQSKLNGELAVAQTLDKFFIVRISWLFGLNGKNFVRTMIELGKTRLSVRVVNDETGTPTYSADLARLIADMIVTDKYGYYHATNEGGFVSWYEFCCEIYRQYGLDTKVIPVTTEEYGFNKAKRPENSRLDKSKLVKAGFDPLPSWQDAVGRYIKEANL